MLRIDKYYKYIDQLSHEHEEMLRWVEAFRSTDYNPDREPQFNPALDPKYILNLPAATRAAQVNLYRETEDEGIELPSKFVPNKPGRPRNAAFVEAVDRLRNGEGQDAVFDWWSQLPDVQKLIDQKREWNRIKKSARE